MNKETVARAIRLEIDTSSDDVYIVFKVIDESFKKKVRENWLEDIPLVVLGKELKEL